MPLAIEFRKEKLTLEDAMRRWDAGEILTNERPQVLTSGYVGVFLKYATMPEFAKHEDPLIPEDLEPYYIYRGRLFDNWRSHEGVYSFEGIDEMLVQHDVDGAVRERYSRVAIAGKSLTALRDAYIALRDGNLRPTKNWSSPGTVAAPTGPANEGGSGSHAVPPMAATVTDKAA